MKVAASSGDSSGVEVSQLAEPVLEPALEASVETDIDALYAEHAQFIGRVLARLTGDGAHVDDLIQETFIVAFKKRETFDGRSTHRTWLYGIASRLALRHRRSLGRWLRALGGFADEPAEIVVAPDRESAIDRERARTVVEDVLAKLPFKHREVFVLYELEELEGADIARMLDIPINTVWTRLHHARKRFQDAMRKRIRREDHVA
jgi:RNA polymerase sigma-70 factor, ECF subfamily